MENTEVKPSLRQILRMGRQLFYKSGKNAYDDPKTYDFIVEKFLGRKKIAKDIVNIIQKHVPKDKNAVILDEAAGTGVVSLELARRGYKVTATDISLEMLTELQVKASKQKLPISTQLSDLNKALPFHSNFFSAITTAHANRYITNLDIFLNEVYRTLKKDGFFVWSVVLAEVIPWKRNTGLFYPTTSISLAKKLREAGFRKA